MTIISPRPRWDYCGDEVQQWNQSVHGLSESGQQLAKLLAQQPQNGQRTTLEMALEASKFEERYKFAVHQLAEELGRAPEWAEFGEKVWARVSQKFAGKLQGRVMVFVDDEVLKTALKNNNLPVLSKELQVLIRRKQNNEGVTEIIIKDIYDGTIFEI